MKRLRIKLPILFCILAYVLWVVGQTLGAFIISFLAGLANIPRNDNITSAVGELGCVLMVLFILKRTGRLQILKEKGIGLGHGLIYGALMVVIAAVSVFVEAPKDPLALNTPLNIVTFTLYMILVGMAEEFLCRGVMAETLLEHYGTERKGILKAVLISSLLFGLSHFTNLSSGVSFMGAVSQVLNAFAVGVFMAIVYLRTGNLWVTVVVHAVWDFLSLMRNGNGLFAGTSTMNDTINDTSSIEVVIPIAIFLAAAYLIFRMEKAQNCIREFFDPYCAMMKEEKNA